MKINDGLLAGVKFLQETDRKKAQLAWSSSKGTPTLPKALVLVCQGHPVGTYHVYYPKTKNTLTNDITFLQKLDGRWSVVEKPVFIFMSHEESDDDEDIETVPANNDNNNKYNVVSYSKCNEEAE